MSGLGLMIGVGGAARYSVAVGQGNYRRANQIFTHSIAIGLVTGFLFLIIGLWFVSPIARFLGAEDGTIVMCRTYLQILMMFGPLFVMNYIMQAFVRNDGSPQRAMAAMVSGSLANIVLDYVFIYPLNLGILGAAVATVCAPAIGLLVSLSFVVQKRNQFHCVACRPSGTLCREICSSGTPSLVTELSNGLVMFVFNHILLMIAGTTGVAAYGVVANLSLVVISMYSGIAQGMQPLISRDFGRQRAGRVKTVLRYGLIAVAGFSAVLYVGIVLGAEEIVLLFNEARNPELQRIASEGLRLYFTGSVFAGWNIVLSTSLAAAEQGRLAGLLSLLRGVILIVPLAAILSATAGMTGLWLAFPLTEIIVTVLGIGRSRKQSWEIRA